MNDDDVREDSAAAAVGMAVDGSDSINETFDPAEEWKEEDIPAFLAPRLAAYATTMPSAEHSDDDEREKAMSNEEEEAEEETEDVEETGLVAGERETANKVPDTFASDEQEKNKKEEEDEEEEEEERVDFVEDGVDEVDGREKEERAEACAREDLSFAFPVSRVKDLLKFEGSSGIIARDACLAASEAVALILRDMATSAAVEARRRNRKTVMYEDVAHIVQLFDRFSYLSDVIPPLAGRAVSGAASSSVVVGAVKGGGPHSTAERMQRGGEREEAVMSGGQVGSRVLRERKKSSSGLKGRTAASKKEKPTCPAPVVVTSSGHPMIPGADHKRQTTLRF